MRVESATDFYGVLGVCTWVSVLQQWSTLDRITMLDAVDDFDGVEW